MVSNIQQNGDVLEVTLEGDLIGGADALSFQKSIREALAGNDGVKRVSINVAGVEFVNSSGLGMLLAARQTAQESGATLQIAEPREQLRSLLDITKLSEILGVKPSGQASGQANNVA